MRVLMSTLIALAIASTPCFAQEPEWQPTKVEDGVQLFAKKEVDEGKTPLKTFKGVVKVKASMKQVLALVLVRETFSSWVYNMLEDRTLTEDNADQSYCYMVIKGQWPTSDRDTVARVTVKQDPKSLDVTVFADSRGVDQKRVPEQEGRIRMTNMYSGFTVRPVSSTETIVELEGFADPAGTIPSFLTNKVASTLPAKTLSALKAKVESGQFDVKALETVPFAQISMKKIVLPQQTTP